MRPKQDREKITLRAAIDAMQAKAEAKTASLQELGVFILYADNSGDAWLLEITDSDCIRIAADGVRVEVPLEETDETIVVDWSHRYTFKNKQLSITSYADRAVSILEKAPSQQIFAAERRILRRYSPELLEQVHISK
jgi:hypothetical protein